MTRYIYKKRKIIDKFECGTDDKRRERERSVSLINGVASRTTYFKIKFSLCRCLCVLGRVLFFIFGLAGVSCGYRVLMLG